MSVIIRLQNLPWSANALDIRQYFHGLGIPEGGVHIVGGELGDAFIAFSTDEDARQAFMRNNGKIKEIQITLMLSSRTEMQRVIEQARSKSYTAFMQPTPTPSGLAPTQVPPMPAAVPAVIPAAVPQIKQEDSKDKNDKKDSKRRSRSRSKERDRRDRSRDRDRKDRRRDRSRSRSRDRKSRRRDRSRSRNRSRSRDRDRRRRDDVKPKRIDDRPVTKPFQRDIKPQQPIVTWGNTVSNVEPVMQTVSLLPTGMNINLDKAKRAIANMQQQQQSNGFPGNNFNNRDRDNFLDRNNRGRDTWQGNPNDNFRNNRNNDNYNDQFYPNNRFQRPNFQGRRNLMEDSNCPDCCVILEPFYGSYSDVRKFFSGLYISSRGIKYINNSSGKRTGVIYVQFGDKRSKNEAMDMHGMPLNNLEVNISHLEDREFEEAVDRFVPNRNNDDDSINSNDTIHFNKFSKRNIPKYSHPQEPEPEEIKEFSCLIVEDLPSYCKEQDILHMFALHPLVALILTPKEQGGPIAYVKFSSKDVAKKALEEKSHHIVSGKPVTVKPCKDDEFEEINKQHDVDVNNGPTKIEPFVSDCLSVSNLPQKTNDKDIADFFSDIGVIPEKIHLMSDDRGFTGQAYCEFTTVEEATRATKKNDCTLGNSVITVVPFEREEMNTILDTTIRAPPEQLAPAAGAGSTGGTTEKLLKLESISPKNFPGPANMNFIEPPERLERLDRMERPERPFFNRHFDNGPPMRGRGGRFGPRGIGPRMRFHAPLSDPEDSVRPGCTVYMKNVPYKAGTNEILEFFDGFNHTGNVSRRYNPNNTPSDEAKVIFVNPDEASKAIDELQKAKIWDRQIYLRQE